MDKQGKVWGETLRLFDKNNVIVNRIAVKKSTQCSRHRHKHKSNYFFVESGLLLVRVWKSSYDLIDDTTLGPGDSCIVPPGEYHQFIALKDTKALEIYWVELDDDDIERDGCGSIVQRPSRRKS